MRDTTFDCAKCKTERTPIDFNDVPEKNKQAVKKMMDAVNPILEKDDDIPAFIVFCKSCNEYSILLLGV